MKCLFSRFRCRLCCVSRFANLTTGNSCVLPRRRRGAASGTIYPVAHRTWSSLNPSLWLACAGEGVLALLSRRRNEPCWLDWRRSRNGCCWWRKRREQDDSVLMSLGDKLRGEYWEEALGAACKSGKAYVDCSNGIKSKGVASMTCSQAPAPTTSSLISNTNCKI